MVSAEIQKRYPYIDRLPPFRRALGKIASAINPTFNWHDYAMNSADLCIASGQYVDYSVEPPLGSLEAPHTDEYCYWRVKA